MKQIIFIMLLAFLVSGSAGAHGQGHDSHGNKSKSETAQHGHGLKGQKATLTGNLIGLTCFIKHGASGKEHMSCAKECIEKGLPMALKSSDGKLYIITGKGHDSLIETYKPLAKYLGSKIMVKGEVFERDDQYMVVINKIKVK